MKKLLMLILLFAGIGCGEGTEKTTTSDTLDVTTDTDTVNASGITTDTTKHDTLPR